LADPLLRAVLNELDRRCFGELVVYQVELEGLNLIPRTILWGRISFPSADDLGEFLDRHWPALVVEGVESVSSAFVTEVFLYTVLSGNESHVECERATKLPSLKRRLLFWW
jgi:hypothetical protein